MLDPVRVFFTWYEFPRRMARVSLPSPFQSPTRTVSEGNPHVRVKFGVPEAGFFFEKANWAVSSFVDVRTLDY